MIEPRKVTNCWRLPIQKKVDNTNAAIGRPSCIGPTGVGEQGKGIEGFPGNLGDPIVIPEKTGTRAAPVQQRPGAAADSVTAASEKHGERELSGT